MTANQINLPYFDLLLSLLDCGQPAIDRAFGRHVHWGYWPNPDRARLTPEDFAQAAERLSREVYAAATVSDGQQVLDVGCGFGGTLASLNEQFIQMGLFGLNIDERQLAQAQRKVTVRESNMLEFEQGTADTLPFPEQTFDLVLAVECIFHFPDREQFFREAYRVLKPGGRLALSDFVPVNWFQPFLKVKFKPISPGFYGDCDPTYTVSRYHQLATTTGFEPLIERDITVQTLPTYMFIESLANDLQLRNFSAWLQTSFLKWASHSGLVRYMILSFAKK